MELKMCKCGGQPKVERGPTNPRDLDYMLTIRCQKCGEKVQRMTGGWIEKEETTLNKLAAEWSAKQAHELRPCPVCGKVPHIGYCCGEYFISGDDPNCPCCGTTAFTEMHTNEEEEIKAWNRRADNG